MNIETAEILSRHIDIIKYKTKEPVEVIKVGEEYAINLPSWSYLERDDILSLISQFYDEYEEKGISAVWSVDSSVKADNLSEIEKVLFGYSKTIVNSAKSFAKVSFEQSSLEFSSMPKISFLVTSSDANTCGNDKKKFVTSFSEKRDLFYTDNEYALAS